MAMAELIMAGTGHRPDKLGGYSERVFNRLVDLAVAAIKHYQPTKIISGMALGWDMALARGAVVANIPFVAAVPFDGQEKMWPEESQNLYNQLIAKCESLEIVSPGSYAASKMQRRNQWMVDHCTTVLALWDGSSGGTGNCVAYAKKVGRPIVNLWGSWVKYK
jgi:uncharacterized phage-like protein YoqJ